VGVDYSIAWRTLDAQYWGVPQRRRRIYLIADFGAQRAAEILFSPESVSWHIAAGGEPGERVARDIVESTPATGAQQVSAIGFDGYNQQLTNDTAQTIQANKTDGDHVGMLLEPKAYGISANSSNAMLSPNPHSGIYEADTARTLDHNGGSPTCNQGGIAIIEPVAVIAFHLQQDPINGESATPCIGAGSPSGQASIGICVENHSQDCRWGINENGKTQTLGANAGMGGNNLPLVITYALDHAAFNQGANAQYNISVAENLAPTIVAKGPAAVAQSERDYAVRRLTPTECARLQGYPDWWCADVPHSDAAEYKMWGNSLAIPCAFFVINSIAKALTARKETQSVI
jgi:DNA (cytosine-5)-methyltransferase 1